MLTSMVQPAKRKLRASLLGGLMLLAFFLLGTERASAQSFVPEAQALQILKDQGNSLYNQMLNETPGTSTYNQLYSSIHYYNAISVEIGGGASVQTALKVSKPAICYPNSIMDCKALSAAQTLTIVQDTEALLSL